MASTDQTTEQPVCPDCGHENIRGAAFCAQCGQSLAGAATPTDASRNSDAQTTSVYTPIGTRSEVARSPWAPPLDGTATTTGTETAAMVEHEVNGSASSNVATTQPGRAGTTQSDSIRGLVLGAIALLIIAAIIGLYVYTAWIDNATRNTVDDWLPWLN